VSKTDVEQILCVGKCECLHYVKPASYTHVNIKSKIDKYIMWTIFEKVVEARAIYMERGLSGKQSRNRKKLMFINLINYLCIYHRKPQIFIKCRT
jgi:hypothetical protein